MIQILQRSLMSQSPQTGQVYFNKNTLDHNKKIRKYFVSIPSNGSSLFQWSNWRRDSQSKRGTSLNPLKRVKFISIQCSSLVSPFLPESLNPLKRVKFISIGNPIVSQYGKVLVSIPSNGSSLFQYANGNPIVSQYGKSQSPQTGQVYFNSLHGNSFRWLR